MEEKYKQQPANCIKVVLFGPESTGKTTLSMQLARHYNSVWVPEYAREYLQNKWNNERKTCEPEDLLPIAEGQMRLENELAKKTDTVLICDTDLLETKVYSEAYYVGNCDPILEKYALENTYDLYFLTYIDVPWEADDLRDKPKERERMFKAFQDTLVKYNRPFILLKGSKKERLQTAINHIDNLLNKKRMFTEQDLKQIQENGLTVEKVKDRIDVIKSGMSYSNLIEAATIGNGILQLNDTQEQDYIKFYDEKRNDLDIVKFVPASGAATRMFKFLFQFLSNYSFKESLSDYIKKHDDKLIETFVDNLEKSPFYHVVTDKIKQFIPNYDELSKDEKIVEFVKTILEKDRLNLSSNPKGLLPFHKYENGIFTAFKEHLFEGAQYASSNQKSNLHFTISEAHTEKFKTELNSIKKDVEAKTNTSFNVSFSYQNKSTDTIAITAKDELYRDENGRLLFRPSGHGALIENLNALDYDLVFIKNIDNVVVSKLSGELSDYKKMMAGILLEAQQEAFKYLHQLDEGDLNESDLESISKFIVNKLNAVLPSNYESMSISEKKQYLHNQLNRPIRVCGMVKNEGEPGGGPFWVKDENGNTSLQIIEFAQIDIDKKDQKDIVDNATHFNPTDLVCGIRNYKGETFNLLDYVDLKAAFITMKSQNGVDIKAYELPGLWNGSMAHWNSIFVEIPVTTFNPVKTVNDLLRPAHQAI